MAYSALIHGFVCLEPTCGMELEMEACDAEVILIAPIEEQVFA